MLIKICFCFTVMWLMCITYLLYGVCVMLEQLVSDADNMTRIVDDIETNVFAYVKEETRKI